MFKEIPGEKHMAKKAEMELGHLLAWGIRGILLLGMIGFLVQGKFVLAGILLMSFAGSGLIYYVCKHYFGKTGEYLDVLFALLVLFNNFFGVVLDFYHTVPGWDIATHYTTSAFLAVSALVLMQRAYAVVLVEAPQILVVIAMVLFSLGLGGLWEIGEFTSDYLRGTNFQQGLVNTMQDLIVDMIAGLVVGIAWVKTRRK